ncbi:hypothetical protein ATN00_01775 [Sphingobium baderi]|uniref:Uncharacterized protein n=1 Tax=Sphingobium baderi TaxID=1332080 RepID=A0A0S3EUX9_9SPHN|nr:hypothetical protein ATN00_01775 [Sphingobium baderi]
MKQPFGQLFYNHPICFELSTRFRFKLVIFSGETCSSELLDCKFVVGLGACWIGCKRFVALRCDLLCDKPSDKNFSQIPRDFRFGRYFIRCFETSRFQFRRDQTYISLSRSICLELDRPSLKVI